MLMTIPDQLHYRLNLAHAPLPSLALGADLCLIRISFPLLPHHLQCVVIKNYRRDRARDGMPVRPRRSHEQTS
jgi:hypothetical protein